MLSLHLAKSLVSPNTQACRVAMAIPEIVEPVPGETTVTNPKPPYTVMVVGDDTLAGDYGFDPLLLADTPKKLAWFREW